MMDLRQATIATTTIYHARVALVTATCCVIAVIGSVMALSWLFAAPPQPPKTWAGGVYRTIVDPKPDGNPYLTVICRDGRSWFADPNA